MEVTCPSCRHLVELVADRPSRCGNCGATVAPTPTNAAPTSAPAIEPPLAVPAGAVAPTRAASIVSLVSSLFVFVPIVPQVVAIVSGLVALLRPRRPNERVALAWIGLFLGLVTLAGWSLSLTFVTGGVLTNVGRTGALPPPRTRLPDDLMETDALVTEMERVYRAAAAYRRDYGAWPDGVARLVGHSLPVDFLLPQSLTYRAPPADRADDGAWVLLVSDPVERDRAGDPLDTPHRLVLRLSGKVELLSVERVRTLLSGDTGE